MSIEDLLETCIPGGGSVSLNLSERTISKWLYSKIQMQHIKHDDLYWELDIQCVFEYRSNAFGSEASLGED